MSTCSAGATSAACCRAASQCFPLGTKRVSEYTAASGHSQAMLCNASRSCSPIGNEFAGQVPFGSRRISSAAICVERTSGISRTDRDCRVGPDICAGFRLLARRQHLDKEDRLDQRMARPHRRGAGDGEIGHPHVRFGADPRNDTRFDHHPAPGADQMIA
jgi:hypothetical protein